MIHKFLVFLDFLSYTIKIDIQTKSPTLLLHVQNSKSKHLPKKDSKFKPHPNKKILTGV